jgi:sugar phosphate isomerase/epimerase
MASPTLKLAKSLWGVPEANDPAQWDALFSRIKAEGFDGVEAITLTWRQDKDRFTSLLQKHGLALICQIHTAGGDIDAKTGAYQYCRSNKLHDHLASFVKLTSEAKARHFSTGRTSARPLLPPLPAHTRRYTNAAHTH